MKTGEALTPRSFKTRAENKTKNTKEFCKVTSLIVSMADCVDFTIGNPDNFGLVGWIRSLSRD